MRKKKDEIQELMNDPDVITDGVGFIKVEKIPKGMKTVKVRGLQPFEEWNTDREFVNSLMDQMVRHANKSGRILTGLNLTYNITHKKALVQKIEGDKLEVIGFKASWKTIEK